MADNQDDSFNASKAEVFEALGHPTRIRLLQTLCEKPLPFSELKRAAGLESNGLLTFHLGKLTGLVKLNSEGSYALTDEGREALRIIEASRKQHEGWTAPRPTLHLPHQKAVLAGLLVILVVLGSVAVYQQQQISSLNRSLSSEQTGSILINGTRFSYVDLPLKSLSLPTILELNGVIFNITPLFGGVGMAVLNVTLSTQPSVNVTPSAQPEAGIPVTLRMTPLPNVQVKFVDGQNENYNPVNATLDHTGTVYFSLQSTNNPWFSHHTAPRAGIYWNSTDDSFVFYVSMGA